MKKFTIKEKLKRLFNEIKPSANVKTVQIPIYGSWIECKDLRVIPPKKRAIDK